MNETTSLAAAFVLIAGVCAGCMPDRMLASRERTTSRLRAEARALAAREARLEAYGARLEAAIRSGSSVGGAMGLLDDLRKCGFRIEAGEKGTLRLRLAAPLLGRDGRLDPVAASRIAHAAALLRERLPDHELSLEAADLDRAVAAVRFLNERAGVPGVRLRATSGRMSGRPGLVVEVRPTRIETLREVIAATED